MSTWTWTDGPTSRSDRAGLIPTALLRAPWGWCCAGLPPAHTTPPRPFPETARRRVDTSARGKPEPAFDHSFCDLGGRRAPRRRGRAGHAGQRPSQFGVSAARAHPGAKHAPSKRAGRGPARDPVSDRLGRDGQARHGARSGGRAALRLIVGAPPDTNGDDGAGDGTGAVITAYLHNHFDVDAMSVTTRHDPRRARAGTGRNASAARVTVGRRLRLPGRAHKVVPRRVRPWRVRRRRVRPGPQAPVR